MSKATPQAPKRPKASPEAREGLSGEAPTMKGQGEVNAERQADELEGWVLPHQVIAEVDPDELFAQWAEQDRLEAEEAQRAPRFSMGRHPILLALVFALSCSLAYRTWPAAEALLRFDDVQDCGSLITRPLLKAKGETPRPFKHLERCELEGVAQHLSFFAIGYQEEPNEPDMFLKNKGVSYVTKLSGDNVFAILPAHEPWVEGYRLKEGSLFGLEFKTTGLMIQPSEEPIYQRLEQQVRAHFHVKNSEPLWIFDVSYSPWDHKMPLATFALSPLLALIALFGLGRALKERREGHEA